MAIKALVMKGLGYAILPAQALHREIGGGQVRAWPPDPPFSRTVHQVLPTDRPLSVAARAVEACAVSPCATSCARARGRARGCG